jgi:hypothetical protein
MPAAWRQRPVIVAMTAQTTFERQPRTRLRLELRALRVGRQRVPTAALGLLLDPATLRFLRLSLPETVDDVQIERGRATITPTASRRRT